MIELFGPARLALGIRRIDLDLGHSVSMRELTANLAGRYPSLGVDVLDVERGTAAKGYIFNRNGREFLIGPEAIVNPGDSILLMSSAVGG